MIKISIYAYLAIISIIVNVILFIYARNTRDKVHNVQAKVAKIENNVSTIENTISTIENTIIQTQTIIHNGLGYKDTREMIEEGNKEISSRLSEVESRPKIHHVTATPHGPGKEGGIYIKHN